MSKNEILGSAIDEGILRDELNSDQEDVSLVLDTTSGSESGDFYAYAELETSNGGTVEGYIDHSSENPPGNVSASNTYTYWGFEYVDENGNIQNTLDTSSTTPGVLDSNGTVSILDGRFGLTYDSADGSWTVAVTKAEGVSDESPIETSITVSAYGLLSEDADNNLPTRLVKYKDTATISIQLTCFTPGTKIQTAAGEVAIETLSNGDSVTSADGGDHRISWIARTVLDAEDLAAAPHMRPVHISQGSLAHGYPSEDLVVSPQHRILLKSKIAQRMFGEDEILVPAKKLVGYPGIFVDQTCETVEYIHLLLETHELVVSNGLISESMLWGKQTDEALWHGAYDEAVALFPELAKPDFVMEPVRTLVTKNGKIDELKRRHIENQVSLYTAA